MENTTDNIVAEALRLSEEGKSLEPLLAAHPGLRTEIEEVLRTARELENVGHILMPSRQSLQTVLRSPQGVPSPLFVMSSWYMNTMTKVALAAIALVVVGGGGYYLSLPGAPTDIALETATSKEAASDMTARTASFMTAEVPTPTPATDSFDDFAAAVAGDVAAQEAALRSVDSEAEQSVASANANSANEPYDETSI